MHSSSISIQSVPPCNGSSSTAAAQGDSDRDSRGVCSADDYMRNDSQLMADYEVPLLGIKVRNGTGKLGDCPRMLGVRVVEVSPTSPAAQAGLRSQQVMGQTALTSPLVVRSIAFPPAVIVLMVVSASGMG